jgi:putative sterol carrier protein
MTSLFMSPEWANGVRTALDAGPDDQAQAAKLAEWWDFYRLVRSGYGSSWALGARDIPIELGGGTRYLVVGWGDGHVTECRVTDDPTGATYVLAADYDDWKALNQGYDALRTVMYRKLLLEEGDLLEFFKAIYFFVESLELIAKVPTEFPANAEVLTQA